MRNNIWHVPWVIAQQLGYITVPTFMNSRLLCRSFSILRSGSMLVDVALNLRTFWVWRCLPGCHSNGSRNVEVNPNEEDNNLILDIARSPINQQNGRKLPRAHLSGTFNVSKRRSIFWPHLPPKYHRDRLMDVDDKNSTYPLLSHRLVIIRSEPLERDASEVLDMLCV